MSRDRGFGSRFGLGGDDPAAQRQNSEGPKTDLAATDLDHFVVNLDSHRSLQHKIEITSDVPYKSQHT